MAKVTVFVMNIVHSPYTIILVEIARATFFVGLYNMWSWSRLGPSGLGLGTLCLGLLKKSLLTSLLETIVGKLTLVI